MTTRPTLVLSSPRTGPTRAHVARHVDRAIHLSKLLTRMGYAVLPLAPLVHTGCWGDDSDPAQRAAGMEAALDLVRGNIDGGAKMFVLLRDDGAMSEDCQREYVLADEMRMNMDPPSCSTWKGWRSDCAKHAPDLLTEWDRLAEPPFKVGPWEPESALSFNCRRVGSKEAIYVTSSGWFLHDPVDDTLIAHGHETGQAGRDAADAALRAMGVPA